MGLAVNGECAWRQELSRQVEQIVSVSKGRKHAVNLPLVDT